MTRLVTDAAARTNRVSLVPAATVVVVSDPTDLLLACSVRAAKLEAVSDTVAVSALPLDKVRAALDRKGLAPTLAAGTTDGAGAVSARSASDASEVADLRSRAEHARLVARRSGNAQMGRQADRLEEMADRLADPRTRLQVPPVLTLTPARAVTIERR